MKRALAERAKQSGLPSGVVKAQGGIQQKSIAQSPHNASSIPDDGLNGNKCPSSDKIKDSCTPSVLRLHVPLSISSPKAKLNSGSSLETKLSLTKSRGSVVRTAPTKASSPRPKKRARESTSKPEEADEDDSNSSSFYLRHQNRALASELRSMKYQVVRLERERDYRRMQCMQAVKSLNTVHKMWEKIELSLGQHSNYDSLNPLKMDSSSLKTNDNPLSTGSGKSVEWLDALMNSLSRIGNSAWPKTKGENVDRSTNQKPSNPNKSKDQTGIDNDEVDPTEAIEDKPNVDNISKLSVNLEERVSILLSWVLCLMENLKNTSFSLNGDSMCKKKHWLDAMNANLQKKLSKTEADNIALQEQMNEMTRSRDEILESDRRVRRGLYRLAAGRMQLKEVLKAIANADEDKEAAASWMEGNIASNLQQPATASSNIGNATVRIKMETNCKTTASPYEIEQLKTQVSDLNTLANSRDKQIKRLMKEKEDQRKKINCLVLNGEKTTCDGPTSEEVKNSELYLELQSKLTQNTRKLKAIDENSVSVRNEWSNALANAEFSKKALEDMQSNFSKRWAELTEEKSEIGASLEESCKTIELEKTELEKAESIVALQHKLTQALENVRQAEVSRKTLDEAISMNNLLQGKVEEFKSKYNSLLAEKLSRASNSASGSSASHNVNNITAGAASTGLVSTPKTKPSSSSSVHSSEKGDRSMEKLHRDYKRARRELSVATASKDAVKAKLERTEKEKEFLSQMNSRLLKQANEKDEINAKSLSTILHLKQLTEQITKEKDNLEKQAKSAEQLTLAARLASNARDRLTEEYNNEQKRLENQLHELEQKCATFVSEKEAAEASLSLEKAKTSYLINDAQKSKQRCEELVIEATKVQEENQKAMESLAIARREAFDATNLSRKLAESKGGGLTRGFTAEQLSTQVTHLKSRLICPVCNVRDKKCILLRCRHMFCKQCIDENVRNRSRKCPACGVRFDTKDIADVWL